jgi:mono/diheme cytochrome c family protein
MRPVFRHRPPRGRHKDSLLKGAALGAAAAAAALCFALYLAATRGLIPANADAKPPALEKWIARRALDAAILREAPKGGNPVPLTDANLLEGIKLYAANCALCHGAADGRPSAVALGLYQKAPQLAKYGVEDDEDGETYWKLSHGIRMTGMPAFRETLTDDELWKLTLFLKNMNALPSAPRRAWDAVPSAGREIQQEVMR